MRRIALLPSTCLVCLLLPAASAVGQVVRIEAESGELNGFSTLLGGSFIEADVPEPTATYAFTGWDGIYDVSVRYCDEDDGTSSYTLSGSSAGAIASWQGDQPTGSTICSLEARLVREVATSVPMEQGETITFACQRDPVEPCRVDYFDFAYIPPQPPPSLQPAFPGAMGFGAGATGARGFGAEVCVVTNLGDSGQDSFRACAEQGPSAYITFAVSGYVDLSKQVDIAANKTIECATAPGDGVVFRGARLHVTGNNAILRGCRAWPGSDPGGDDRSVRDAIIVGNENGTVRRAIVANNSAMLGVDETAGTWFPVEDITFQHNIIAWTLAALGPDDSLGMLLANGPSAVSVVENYLAFNFHRNPEIKAQAKPLEFVNNLVYCFGQNGVVAWETTNLHVVGNRFKKVCPPIGAPAIKLRTSSIAYVVDNTKSDGMAATVDPDVSSDVSAVPLFVSTITPVSSGEVEGRVFANAGPAKLLAFDIDAFEHYVDGTGGLVESVDDLGGWPTLQGGANPPDSDGDGLPDWWEAGHCGGNCAPTGDHDGDGYENIEEWFHSFYRRRAPVALDVDPSPLSSNGNGVFEPGEQVEVAPSWRNDGSLAVVLDGIAAGFGGPAGAAYTVIADDASYGTVGSGGTASCQDTSVCYEMGVNDPAVRPASHWDAGFDESLSEASTQTWTLHVGNSFTDVASTSQFYEAVETMLHHGVSSGCGGNMYCPTDTVNRGQMPVVLLKAKEGASYLPPACVSGEELFDDVPASNPLCRWIEELANRGVVSGCSWTGYCPSYAVTRAQMARFLLRTLEGGSYTPPGCSGVFADVPCPSTFANWIEDVYARGIAGGCSSTPPMYCPTGTVSRGQMAVFVGNTFGLTLYGP